MAINMGEIQVQEQSYSFSLKASSPFPNLPCLAQEYYMYMYLKSQFQKLHAHHELVAMVMEPRTSLRVRNTPLNCTNLSTHHGSPADGSPEGYRYKIS